VLAGFTWAAAARAQPAELELPSCVSGSPPLRLSAAEERAVLDTADRKRFDAAAQARFPLYRRGGLVPTQVLMLRRRGGRWQYVTLWRGGPAGLCFSAVFAAERFDFTADWIAKYQPRAAEPAD
jgi:hypothetical protein